MIKRPPAVGLWVLALVALAGFACAGSADSPSETATTGESFSSGRLCCVTAQELIEASELIVMAEFVSERDERVQIRNPETRRLTNASRDDVLRSYRVVETIKGALPRGAEIVVWNTRRYTAPPLPGRPDPSWSSELLPAEKGKTYVLFLRNGVRECELLWGQIGEPSQAEVQRDTLRFQTTARYREALAKRGVTLAPGADAPFDLTLPELRQLSRAALEVTPRPTSTRPLEPPIGQLQAAVGTFFSPEALVAKSDLIVLAEFLSERDDRVEVVYKRQFVGGIRDDVARTYRILETIKGGQHPGGQIVVWWSRQYQELDPFRAMGAAPPPGYVQPGPRVYEQPPAERGKVYALFLTLLPYEEPIWSWTGDPWQAELAGNRLKFQAVSWYQGMCDGKLAPGSQAPFELTLPQLRELARPP